MKMSCTERKATGMCGGRLVPIDRTKLSASCCDTCGAYGYTHLSMAQLLKHVHRNEDLKEEYMERACDDMHAKEALANEAAIKAKAAEALVVAEKKRCYIEKVDAKHVAMLTSRQDTAEYMTYCCDVLRDDGNNEKRARTLQMLLTYKIHDKIEMLLASGLPNVVKSLSSQIDTVDGTLQGVLVLAAEVKNLWKVAIRARMVAASAASAASPESAASPSSAANKKRSPDDSNKRRILKKFKGITSGE